MSQQPEAIGAMSAGMLCVGGAVRQQQDVVPSQAIRKAAAAWPVRVTIISPTTRRHMIGLRFKLIMNPLLKMIPDKL